MKSAKGCLVLVLLALVPATSRAGDTAAESKFRDQVSWDHGNGRVTLRSRPESVYLVGGSKVSVMISDESGCDCRQPVGEACKNQCSLPEELAVFAVDPLVGFLPQPGGKCHDRLCLPDTCPRSLCPPDTLPLPVVAAGQQGRLPGLGWSRNKDAVKVTSTSKDTVFWVVEEGRARLVFPGQSLNAKAPASVYQFECIGRFSPAFTPASQLDGPCPLQPCRDRALEKGLCPASSVFSP